MELSSVARTATSPFPIAWIGIAIVSLAGLGMLGFLFQAIYVTYQMLRGLKPDVRKGALLGAVSIVGESAGGGYFFNSPEGVGDYDSDCDA